MTSTDELIASLSGQAHALNPARPITLFTKWLAVSLACAAALLLFSGPRDDLAVKLHTPLFLGEIISLLGITVASGISAVALSFPDMVQRRWVVFTPVVPLTLFIACMAAAWLRDDPPSPQPPHGIECLLCITMYSSLPAVWMLYLLRKQASTHYYWAGGIALLAATSVGCLALRLCEKTDSITHLVEWHYLPMIGFGMLGLWLGRTFLKW